MPELPEVETIVRGLVGLAGRRIEAVTVIAPLVVRSSLEAVAGQSISAVRRHGKFIVFECEAGNLTVHLGMTGKLLPGGARTPYTRVVFALDDGTDLLYDDVRQFGRVEWQAVRLSSLGPDALEITAEDFIARLRARRGRIKPVLLNQTFVRGLGNIYVDETLFRSGVHPLAVCSRLSRVRAARVHATMREVLSEAIAHRGSSVSDYVDADGERGDFQSLHRVYGREGEPCVVCGKPIRRIVVGQRGTHFCGACQRK